MQDAPPAKLGAMNDLSKLDLERLQGKWRQVRYERDGVVSPQDDEASWNPLTAFLGDTFRVEIADGSVPIAGLVRLDASHSPKHVDYHDTHGEYAGTTFLAIYTLEDDVFSFCAGGAGEPRPTAFSTGPGQVLRVMVREV